MPKRKAKTRKSIAKRFKFTKSGKVMRRLAGQDHYRQKMTGKQRRQMRSLAELAPSVAKKVKKALAK